MRIDGGEDQRETARDVLVAHRLAEANAMLKLTTDDDLERFLRPYRIDRPGRVSLSDYDPADTDSLPDDFKDEARELLERSVAWMAEQQPMLAAEDKQALLIILQGRDAAGKDSTIRHVMSGLNPQGCHVTSFKHPSYEALDHDYLWRYHQRLPGRGEIGIFNRSHYEEVLIVRVHPQILAAQRIPDGLAGDNIWRERFEDIGNFERYLARNGVHILKFFLNISREEQRKRFLKRLESPEKHWKFSQADIEERAFWDDYTLAYEEAIGHTAAPHAPWYIVPADHKWFSRLVVAWAVVARLRAMDLHYPQPGKEQLRALRKARKALRD